MPPQAPPPWADNPCMEDSEHSEDDIMNDAKKHNMESDVSFLKSTTEKEPVVIPIQHIKRGNLNNSENLPSPMHLEQQDTSNHNTCVLTNQQNHLTPNKNPQYKINPPIKFPSPTQKPPIKSPSQKKPPLSPKRITLVSPKKSNQPPSDPHC